MGEGEKKSYLLYQTEDWPFLVLIKTNFKTTKKARQKKYSITKTKNKNKKKQKHENARTQWRAAAAYIVPQSGIQGTLASSMT
jgi:hypothetical protein